MERKNGPKGLFRSRFSILGQAPREAERAVRDLAVFTLIPIDTHLILAAIKVSNRYHFSFSSLTSKYPTFGNCVTTDLGSVI